MTIPAFRSTAAYAVRARSRGTAIERATFVTFSVGGRRYAAAVEAVERVLRWTGCAAGGGDAIARDLEQVCYAGREIPVVDFAQRLGVVGDPSERSRVLVLNIGNGWLAALVDAVHEITTVDASSISLVGIVPALVMEGAGGTPAALAGARGTFVRDGREILVLDVARALGFRFT